MKGFFDNYEKKDWYKLGLLIGVTGLILGLPMVLILEYITKPAQAGAELVLTPFHEADLYDQLTPEQAYQGYVFVYLTLFLPFVPLVGYLVFFGYFADLIFRPLGLTKLKNPFPSKSNRN